MDKKDRDYKLWSEDSYFDEETRNELKGLSEAEIQDRFYKDLEFGTGGLRGVMGAGTNRMNRYTVRKATQGLANDILSHGKEGKGVAIAYDSRNRSQEFAQEAALCLNGNGIPAYVFDSLRPTPELSFALRKLNCVAGIVVTASHNPPEYNGYKVYWEDGAQITYPKDKEIIDRVNQVTDYAEVRTMSLEEATDKGLYHTIGKEIDDAYEEELEKLVLHKECIEKVKKDLKIVYTPLHGTGNLPVQNILKKLGFEQVYIVEEQREPDGNFPTVSYPNPEDETTFEMALALAKKVDADLVLATDPDADRLGVYAKDSKTGEYFSFTGNMSGVLIGEYETSQRKALGILPDNGAWVRTIVTTKMADRVAEDYNMKLIEVLTGFKYIGEQIKFFEEQNTQEYVFGFEESYGCLVGTHARDKDAIVAVMALCEAAAYCKCNGMTLWDQMIKLYEKYGYYKEGLLTMTLKGIEGAAQIVKIMEKLRNNPMSQIAGYQVLKVRDYKNGVTKDLQTKEEYSTGLPASDVLYYDLSDDAWFCVRPSGTEPKIKFYAGVKGVSMQDSVKRLEDLKEALGTLSKND